MAQHFDITKHFKTLRRQGATIIETKDGYLVRSRNGGQVCIHNSHRGQNPHTFKRTVSQLSKIGLTVGKDKGKPGRKAA